MTTASLAGARAKIDRGKEHLDCIEAAIKDAMTDNKSEPRSAPYEFDQDTHQLIIRHPKPTPIDPALPLVTGDCVHNFRSALDHLVLQLALLNNTFAVAEKKTEFPVCLTAESFQRSVKDKVAPFVSPDAVAAIEIYQPYRTDTPAETSPLWLLSQLDIIDKHRVLVVVAHKFSPIGFTVEVPTGQRLEEVIPEPKWKSVEDEAEMMRFDLSGAITEPGRVRVKLQTMETVQIQNTGLECDGLTLVTMLSGFQNIVVRIVGEFGKQFFGE